MARMSSKVGMRGQPSSPWWFDDEICGCSLHVGMVGRARIIGCCTEIIFWVAGVVYLTRRR